MESAKESHSSTEHLSGNFCSSSNSSNICRETFENPQNFFLAQCLLFMVINLKSDCNYETRDQSQDFMATFMRCHDHHEPLT